VAAAVRVGLEDLGASSRSAVGESLAEPGLSSGISVACGGVARFRGMVFRVVGLRRESPWKSTEHWTILASNEHADNDEHALSACSERILKRKDRGRVSIREGLHVRWRSLSVGR
jgi:hypothetical protein